MIKEAIEKARAYSDNKDKIDAYYDGYVACYLELEKQLKAEHTRGEIDFVNMHCNSSCKKVKELEDKIKHLTKHLEPQSMSALFEQVEEEVKQKQRIAELEAQIEKMKCCHTCDNNKEEHTPEEHYRCKTCKKFCNWELAD